MNARATLTFILLVALGCMQMAADVLGLPQLKGFAAATQVAPAMKVFTAHEGYETHAARFSVHWRDSVGGMHELPITPEIYKEVEGPYNRRNVYGAALAYGPLLRANDKTREMQASVMRYAFCDPGSISKELRLPDDATQLFVRVTPVRTPLRSDLDYEWEIDCHE
jgi:hypothetical protein